MAHPIPLFYRLFFLYLDPLVNLSGIYLCFFSPSTYIQNGVPSPLVPTSTLLANLPPLTTYLIHALGAWSLAIFSLQILVLHQYKTDVKLWKIFQFSVLLIDLALVYSIYVASPETALDVRRWNQGDWTNNGILAVVAVVRSAFLVGVGGVGGGA